jgi:hypothetical protein
MQSGLGCVKYHKLATDVNANLQSPEELSIRYVCNTSRCMLEITYLEVRYQHWDLSRLFSVLLENREV